VLNESVKEQTDPTNDERVRDESGGEEEWRRRALLLLRVQSGVRAV